jgi:hypothetical protein
MIVGNADFFKIFLFCDKYFSRIRFRFLVGKLHYRRINLMNMKSVSARFPIRQQKIHVLVDLYKNRKWFGKITRMLFDESESRNARCRRFAHKPVVRENSLYVHLEWFCLGYWASILKDNWTQILRHSFWNQCIFPSQNDSSQLARKRRLSRYLLGSQRVTVLPGMSEYLPPLV